jgi:hypothetical protein
MIAEEAEALANHPESLSKLMNLLLPKHCQLDDKTLDKLFDTEATKFQEALKKLPKKHIKPRRSNLAGKYAQN